MNKRRRYDQNISDDTTIIDFLDRHPKLYNQIQLSVYLEKLTETRTIPFQIDITSPQNFCKSIGEGIKSIILKFYPELTFGNSYGKTEYEWTRNDGKITCITFWVYGYNDNVPSEFYEISGESFHKYFEFLSNQLSKNTSNTVNVFLDENEDCSLSISVSY